ncbi:TetR family transcriptional regulator [Mycobacterium sp. E2479]|nr:TetR family transcriptional regulator [Mycobacterium sp. E2479]
MVTAMSPRASAVEAARTRDRILTRSVAIASVEGLDGLTLGRLAADLNMSKAGVIGHFGAKETLQIATLDKGYEVFEAIAFEPAGHVDQGLPRVLALCEGWIRYLLNEGESFPGGCLFTTAAVEFDARGGPVRAAVAELFGRWQDKLSHAIGEARDAGHLPPSTDVAQVVFELIGTFTAMNLAVQLFADKRAAMRARRAVARILGLADPGTGRLPRLAKTNRGTKT